MTLAFWLLSLKENSNKPFQLALWCLVWLNTYLSASYVLSTKKRKTIQCQWNLPCKLTYTQNTQITTMTQVVSSGWDRRWHWNRQHSGECKGWQRPDSVSSSNKLWFAILTSSPQGYSNLLYLLASWLPVDFLFFIKMSFLLTLPPYLVFLYCPFNLSVAHFLKISITQTYLQSLNFICSSEMCMSEDGRTFLIGHSHRTRLTTCQEQKSCSS